MIWYNILCVGDSQTFGARSYGCYPVYLAKSLRETCHTEYRTINRSVNGYTARDLWYKLNEEIDGIQDTYIACLMIGTNDVRKQTDIALFREYVYQMLLAFKIKGYIHVYVGGIPPIVKKDADPFYPYRVEKGRIDYQVCLDSLVDDFGEFASFVSMDNLEANMYEDSVHFNEFGNRLVANNFAKAMVAL